MAWFFLSVLALGLALKYWDKLKRPKIHGVQHGTVFTRSCAHCNREIRYRIAGSYDFADCDFCGGENFLASPHLDPALFESLTQLDSLLPADHRLFDFFTHTYIISCLAIAKSDGVISGSERDFILRKLRGFLGNSGDEKLMRGVYTETVKHFARFHQPDLIEFTLVYELWHTLLFIRKNLPQEPAQELIQFLTNSVFETAYADEVLDPREESLLRKFASRLGLNEREFGAQLASAKAYIGARNAYDQFAAQRAAGRIPTSVYDFFGVTKSSTKGQVKKAYYALAKQYHPDKYNNLPEEMQKSAEDKFKEIGRQYELLMQHAPD